MKGLGQTTLGDLTYTYDASGQRTSVGGSWARTGLPQALASATYDAGNRIATWAGTSFTLDQNGNVTGDGTTTYGWNIRNQLTAVSGGASATFQYDAVARRRGKTINSSSTNFLYDGVNVVQELSGSTPTAHLLTGFRIDETFTRTDAGGTSTLLTDAIGSSLALASSSGTVQTTYTYDPFGATTTSGTLSPNVAQFTGRENDGAGAYFNRARFYSPTVQRFLSEDPIEFGAADVNLYAYVRNQPTIWRDPSGLFLYRPRPGTPCYIPPNGRKDEPAKPPLSWYFTCTPFVVPDLIPPLPPFPWPTGPQPPPGPRPPGYDPTDPGWRYGHPEGPELRPPRWFDPDGGEWRYHPQDPWHPDPHWDHNPWDQWNSPWKNVPLARIEEQPDMRERKERVVA